jgi:hypothetical protein
MRRLTTDPATPRPDPAALRLKAAARLRTAALRPGAAARPEAAALRLDVGCWAWAEPPTVGHGLGRRLIAGSAAALVEAAALLLGVRRSALVAPRGVGRVSCGG